MRIKDKYKLTWGAALASALALFIVMTLNCSTTKPFKPGEEEAYGYITRQVLNDDGRLITYPTDKPPFTPNMGIWPNDILAESMGLALLYFVKTNRPEQFDKTWWFIKERMLAENGLISWKFDATKWEPLKSSAAIDDFRVIRALFLAHRKWKIPEYFEFAKTMGASVLKHEVVDDHIVEFYSWQGDPGSSKRVDISYLDLYTMELLTATDPQWRAVLDKSTEVVLGAFTSNGLFHDKYMPENNSYHNVENNLINKLLCAIHLAEVGIYKSEVIRFIEDELFHTGTLKGRYNSKNGEATVNFDSAAVYALALRFAVLYDREALIGTLLKQLLAFQQHEKDKILRGCFGYQNCHTFDSLQALLALSGLERRWFQVLESENK